MLIALVKSIPFIQAQRHKQYAEGIVYPKNTVCTANTAIASVKKPAWFKSILFIQNKAYIINLKHNSTKTVYYKQSIFENTLLEAASMQSMFI